MKLKLYHITFLLLVIISSCKNDEEKSNSITDSDRIKFTLRNKNYRNVSIGTDILGEWRLFPMRKNNGYWAIYFYDTHKTIQYKFLIDNSYWMRDPKNKRKIKLLPPYEGYNSFIN